MKGRKKESKRDNQLKKKESKVKEGIIGFSMHR
jgi:hypothetical protein